MLNARAKCSDIKVVINEALGRTVTTNQQMRQVFCKIFQRHLLLDRIQTNTSKINTVIPFPSEKNKHTQLYTNLLVTFL